MVWSAVVRRGRCWLLERKQFLVLVMLLLLLASSQQYSNLFCLLELTLPVVSAVVNSKEGTGRNGSGEKEHCPSSTQDMLPSSRCKLYGTVPLCSLCQEGGCGCLSLFRPFSSQHHCRRALKSSTDYALPCFCSSKRPSSSGRRKSSRMGTRMGSSSSLRLD